MSQALIFGVGPDGKTMIPVKVDADGNLTGAGGGGGGTTALTRTALLAAATATGAGSAVADSGRAPSFTADVSGTGTVSATVLIQGRNVASGAWTLLGTITLSGSASASDGFASLTRYMEYRANLTAISGTSATVNVAMGS
mgnify:FL=1